MQRVYIVGAGGIGCAIGYTLCAAGLRPEFVETDERKLRWGQAHGVRFGRLPARSARFVPFEHWHPSADALVLLCTKCYDNQRVLERIPPSAVLVPIQNGFDPALNGRHGNLEGIASFVAECHADRPLVRMTRGGSLHLGSRQQQAQSASATTLAMTLARLAARLQRHAPFRVRLVPDIEPYKYTKLMFNAAINPLAAAAGLDNGQLLALPKARALFFALLRENLHILNSRGIALGKIGPFHPATIARILDRPHIARFLAWLLYPTLRGSYCSMSEDLPRGCTEIDYFNRHLIELAGTQPCPLNRRVYALIKEMEHTRMRPGMRMLERL